MARPTSKAAVFSMSSHRLQSLRFADSFAIWWQAFTSTYIIPFGGQQPVLGVGAFCSQLVLCKLLI